VIDPGREDFLAPGTRLAAIRLLRTKISISGRRAALAIRAAAESPSLPEYRAYWNTLAPRNDADFFRRWLFAYASVQTDWRRNVLIYRRLAEPDASFQPEDVARLLREIGAGMITVRTEGLSRLHRDYWRNPAAFRPAWGEPFAACRDRLVELVHGLGIAKVAFVLELCYPLACEVVCLDRHLLRLYGCDGNSGVSDGTYRAAEAHWIRTCRRHDIPCALARHIYWDGVQGQRDTRYWSHVFEEPEPVVRAAA
jgi:hypothetical protein